MEPTPQSEIGIIGQVFIGSCSGITGPCCHGSDRRDVLRQLVRIVSDWLEDEEETEVAVG